MRNWINFFLLIADFNWEVSFYFAKSASCCSTSRMPISKFSIHFQNFLIFIFGAVRPRAIQRQISISEWIFVSGKFQRKSKQLNLWNWHPSNFTTLSGHTKHSQFTNTACSSLMEILWILNSDGFSHKLNEFKNEKKPNVDKCNNIEWDRLASIKFDGQQMNDITYLRV